jgi:hypothetical protein
LFDKPWKIGMERASPPDQMLDSLQIRVVKLCDMKMDNEKAMH